MVNIEIEMEFFVFKSNEPLQSCYLLVQKNVPRKAELD